LLIFILIISFFDIKKISPSEIIVELEAKVPEDDLFMVYYLQEGMQSLNDQKSSFIRIKGSDEFQNIQLPIPANLPIETIRIDIGRNIKQKPMEIKYITLKSPSASFIYKDNMFELFKPNYFTEIKDGLIFTKQVAGRYDPFLSPNTSISLVLKELRKEYYPRPVWLPYLIGFIFSLSVFLFLYHKNLNSEQQFSFMNIYIIVFLCLLLTPSIVKSLNLEKQNKNMENRELAAMPDLSLSEEFPKEFETYYNDNFGLRNDMVEWSSKLKINIFHSSPRPKEVQFGKSQFLFYNKEEVFDSYTNRNLMTPESLNAYGEKIIKRKNKLDSMGIQYVCGFWPNKHTIYPELLPYSMSSQIKGNISLADQLVHYFKEKKMPFFDIRNDLLALKNGGLLYHKLDTHWNNRGAFFAYQSFCSKTFSTLKLTPYDNDQFEVENKTSQTGDLTMLLGVNKILGNEDPDYNYILKDKSISFTRIDNPKGFPIKSIITKNENCNNRKKVLIFKDSFMTALVQFFSLHYYEVTYVHGSYDESMVNIVKPDIVINCRAERHIEFL
tara:strand:+ start:5467 stop:7125 length:1659 start_codon:yes stop_codon:yes gene_type:complete